MADPAETKSPEFNPTDMLKPENLLKPVTLAVNAMGGLLKGLGSSAGDLLSTKGPDAEAGQSFGSLLKMNSNFNAGSDAPSPQADKQAQDQSSGKEGGLNLNPMQLTSLLKTFASLGGGQGGPSPSMGSGSESKMSLGGMGGGGADSKADGGSDSKMSFGGGGGDGGGMAAMGGGEAAGAAGGMPIDMDPSHYKNKDGSVNDEKVVESGATMVAMAAGVPPQVAGMVGKEVGKAYGDAKKSLDTVNPKKIAGMVGELAEGISNEMQGGGSQGQGADPGEMIAKVISQVIDTGTKAVGKLSGMNSGGGGSPMDAGGKTSTPGKDAGVGSPSPTPSPAPKQAPEPESSPKNEPPKPRPGR